MFQPETNPRHLFNSAFGDLVDKALQDRRNSQPRRQYLGASTWGEECARKLAYGYHQVPQDEDRGFKGDTLRIFDMGHDGEDRVAEYLRLAGFNLLTHDQDGKQFGFSAADGRLKGHIDGVILEGPALPGLVYPALWENKMLNNKGWTDVRRNGVKEAKPLYYAQAQTYMVYKELPSALFTAGNRDSGEILGEVILPNPQDAQVYSDRAVRVIQSASPEEFGRITKDSTDFRCKFCDWRQRCWDIKPVKVDAQQGMPSWLNRS